MLAAVLALVLFSPLAFIYGRIVASRIHARAEAKSLSRFRAGLPYLTAPFFLAACLAVRLVDPYERAVLLGRLAENGILSAILSLAEFIGSIALILFFLTVPFVLGRLIGVTAALGGYFRKTHANPLRFGVAAGEEELQPKRSAMPPLTIAIDGPAAAGKGTLAKRLARHYALPYLDTGLLYRAVGRRAQDAGVDLADGDAAAAIARTLDPAVIDEAGLRGREAGELASQVAVHPGVRSALNEFQRAFAARPEGAVLDGRDIGTVICPEAPVKIFVTASAQVRARRRTDELTAKGRAVEYERILAEVRERDRRDAGRTEAPLKPAPDAALLDTSELDIEAAFRAACDLVDRAIGRKTPA